MNAGVTQHARQSPADTLRACFAAAVAAVEPEQIIRAALDGAQPHQPCWIIAVGKASPGMARGLVGWLAERHQQPAGGIIIAAESVASPHPALVTLVGDHPIPGHRSRVACNAIARMVERMPADAEVHVAISGGTSALIAGPLDGIAEPELITTYQRLLDSGLPIDRVNAVRKRISRWTAGRLALALDGRRLHVWAISDVPGDDLADIGSGPCTGDRIDSTSLQTWLRSQPIWAALPGAVQRAMTVATPRTDDARFAAVTARVIGSNRIAKNAATTYSASVGLKPRIMSPALEGDAATRGSEIAIACQNLHPGELWVWGGETTVALDRPHGVGGRSQELALAAARQLHADRSAVTILAAGTDGRDGPTDAAGAIVDAETWARLLASGRDPVHDLGRHDSYPALDAAGALLRIGATGSNVADLVLAINPRPHATP